MKTVQPIPPIVITLERGKDAEPLNEQIYRALRTMILEGDLRAGDKLPASRSLAMQLGVGRVTVTTAYASLTAEGYLASTVGSGTVVAARLPASKVQSLAAPRAGNDSPAALAALSPAARIAEQWSSFRPQKLQPFAVISPDAESLPGKKWTQIVARYSKSPWLHNSYCEPGGHALFRRAIAQEVHRTRGISCDPEQVIVTCGVMQGLTLCCRILFQPADQAAIENPAFELHRAVLAYNGIRPVGVAVDSNGLRVDELKRTAGSVRGVVLTPSHQYPLGSRLSIERRKELVDWAYENGTWIIEDDYDNELVYDGSPFPALAVMDTHQSNVIYLGSFTKMIYPGFNLGFVIVPKRLVKAFEGAKLLCDRHASEVHQVILGEFIREGGYAAHIRRLKKLYGLRRVAFINSARHYLGGWADILSGNQGTHATVVFRIPLNDVELCARLHRAGIECRALSECYFGASHKKFGLILGFAGFTEGQIESGMQKLAEVVENFVLKASSGN